VEPLPDPVLGLIPPSSVPRAGEEGGQDCRKGRVGLRLRNYAKNLGHSKEAILLDQSLNMTNCDPL
jgi:hypothetical protein